MDRKIREEKAKQEEQKKGACMCGPAPEIWIWWLDWDTIITNTTVKLENLVREAKGRWERGVLQPEDDEDNEKDEGKEQNKNEKPKSDGVSRKDGKEGAEMEDKEVGQKKQYDKKEEEGVIIDDILVGKDLKKEADQTAAAEEKEELDMIITADWYD